MLFDTHAHYDDDAFDEDRDEVIKKVFESGVTCVLNASSNIASSEKSVSLAQRYDFIYAAVGVHPHDAQEADDDTVPTLTRFASGRKVVAIGEIGLDYYYDNSPRDIQKQWFIRQINLAKDIKLPIIIHDRESHEDVMNIVKSEGAASVGGIFHCFSGSVEMARDVLKNNFHIAVGGSLTFKNAKRPVEVVEYVPMDRLLLETDCPYMTPHPFRGRRNDSTYLRLVAEKVAQIKGLTLEEIIEVTTKNAKTLFKID